MAEVSIRDLRNHGDAMIAATAVANDLPVYTSCNRRDFSGIDGLEVVAVPVPLDPSARSASGQSARDPENPPRSD